MSFLFLSRPQNPFKNQALDLEYQWTHESQRIEASLESRAPCVYILDLEFLLDEKFEKIEQMRVLSLFNSKRLVPFIVWDEKNKFIEQAKDFSGQAIWSIENNFEKLKESSVSLFSQLKQNEQDRELEKIISNQTESLSSLQNELRDRVEKRQVFLLQSREKTYQASTRWEILKSSLEAIYKSHSLHEVESALNQYLVLPLQLSSLKLQLLTEKNFNENLNEKLAHSYSVAEVPLQKDREKIGSLILLRPKDQKWNREEMEFIQRLSEAVTLSLARLQEKERTVSLKEQWQLTFNSIEDYVILVNENYDLLQINQKVENRMSPHLDATHFQPHQKCHEVLFGRSTPCSDCRLGTKFARTEPNQTLEVSSQKMDSQHHVYVNFYHDITERQRLENTLIEKARLSELGIIGSSMAHELNNPLGGMLSYIQLILMDMDAKHPWREDLKEMESGVRRCAGIVETMLGFSRREKEQPEILDVKDLFEKTIRLAELKSKYQNITHKILDERSNQKITARTRGFGNQLIQGFKNLLVLLADRSALETTANSHAIYMKISDGPVTKTSPLSEIPGSDQPTPKAFFKINFYIYSADKTFDLSLTSLSFSVTEQILHNHQGSLQYKPSQGFEILLPVEF